MQNIILMELEISAYFTYLYSGLGITAAVHRLWAHRSYKAKWPLKLILMTCNTMASQMSVIRWTKDHRLIYGLKSLIKNFTVNAMLFKFHC